MSARGRAAAMAVFMTAALACAGAGPKTAPLSAVMQTSVALDGADLSLHLPSDTEPPLPGVLMFHSAMGRTDAVLGYADMLAQAGFGVGALDLYGGRVPADVAEARTMRDALNASSLDFPALLSAAQDVLEKDERVRADHHYVVGWSYGGALATLAAGWLDRISGVIAIYGEAFGDDPQRLDAVSAPVLLIGGRTDTEPSPARLQEVHDALSGAGKDASVVVLDAGHGFMEPRHPGFDREAARAAWLEVHAFLEARER